MEWNLELARFVKAFSMNAGLLTLVLIAITVVFWRQKRGLTALGLACLFFLQIFFCAPWASRRMAKALVDRVDPIEMSVENAQCLNSFSAVALLGGGIVARDLPGSNAQLRVLRAAEFLNALAVQKQRRLVILSGGVTNPEVDQPEAEALAHALKLQLTPEARALDELVLENASRNTRENALLVRDKLLERGLPPQVIVVTSDVHMLRAIGAFRGVGLQPCVLSSPTVENGGHGFLDFANGVNTVSLLNETLGILGYKLKGWIL